MTARRVGQGSTSLLPLGRGRSSASPILQMGQESRDGDKLTSAQPSCRYETTCMNLTRSLLLPGAHRPDGLSLFVGDAVAVAGGGKAQELLMRIIAAHAAESQGATAVHWLRREGRRGEGRVRTPQRD